MANDLANRINIGKETEFKLKQAGINSVEELCLVGSEQAFIRLQAIDPGACLNLLYALEGAVEDIRWHDLPKEKKQELLRFFKMATKK